MTAIEEVKAKLESSGLGGTVEKTHHQLLKGYWWFPESGKDVFLEASKKVALVAIDAERYRVGRDRERETIRTLARACGATVTNPRED